MALDGLDTAGEGRVMNIEILLRTVTLLGIEIWEPDTAAGEFASRGAAMRYILEHSARYPSTIVRIDGQRYLAVEGKLTALAVQP